MSSSELIGHKKQVMQLTQDLESGNLSHAYLFAGSKHVGKTTLAHWFAREILLRDVPADQQSDLLHKMDELIHQDFLVLDQLWMEERMEDWDFISQSSNVPQQHRAKAKVKSDIIGIDDVREIQQRLNETGDLPHRVCIIRGVERMNESAANGFLKILEEPPKGRVFIFTTESLSSLLPTIISRTRVLRLERVGDREIQAMLQDMDQEDANFIIHASQGAPGMAVRLKEDTDALLAEKTLHAQAMGFWNSPKLLDRLKQLEPLEDKGPEADRYLFHLALALRQIPDYPRTQEQALSDLIQGLKTNAHRGLQLQNFALTV
jgi:DNA polymerase-3 subunit delta'